MDAWCINVNGHVMNYGHISCQGYYGKIKFRSSTTERKYYFLNKFLEDGTSMQRERTSKEVRYKQSA